MTPFEIPVRRPIATAMVFTALVLLGVIAWQKIPVELFPAISGDQLQVNFVRPGSEAEAVEREILIPLEGRISELPGVEETNAQITGSSGFITIRFEKDADIKVRELDLRRVAADLAHTQPPGTVIDVGASMDFSAMSRFVMIAQVTAAVDRHALRSLVEERIEPRLSGVPGVSRVLIFGGSEHGVSVFIDPDKSTALGLSPSQVTAMLSRTVARPRFVGGIEDEGGRRSVLLDGQPAGLDSLADTAIVPGRPAQLRHVARIVEGAGREEGLYRVNGATAVGILIFKKEDANLVRLGTQLRERLDTLREEFHELGVDFLINFDAAELVDNQINRLKRLAAGGFLIALLALYLFLRQLRAVIVVVVSVPVSILIALALLYVSGQTLNLITLFGLAVGLGMLVDNAIVVYEAVQRQLERGSNPDRAAAEGVRRTMRAIIAATATNAVVFLPLLLVDLPDTSLRSMLAVLTVAYLLPLVGSLLVALGLVPLLARHLAAPAALARLRRIAQRRTRRGGLSPPDRGRELFGALIKVALHHPGSWLAGVLAAVILTALVTSLWLGTSVSGMGGQNADEVQMAVELPPGSSLETSSALMKRMEGSVLRLNGVEKVSSFIQEGSASLTVTLDDPEDRPAGLDASRVRKIVTDLAENELQGVEVTRPGEGRGGGQAGGDDRARAIFGDAPAEFVLSGPDAAKLHQLAQGLRAQLVSIPEILTAFIPGSEGMSELHVRPNKTALAALGLSGDQILPALSVLRREGIVMRTGITLRDGRELPLTVYREKGAEGKRGLEQLRIPTAAGAFPLPVLASLREMPPVPSIAHHNGRRELSVRYRFSRNAPRSGPQKEALDKRIRKTVQQVHRPTGYAIEAPPGDEQTSWFRKIVVPVVLLLFAVLAVTFESLVLPLLVLLALPMTLIGATWTLILTGTPPDFMVIVGALALLGLTVNPAILLVDRMQERMRGGFCGPGGAALAAVRERARPVLMTTVTTVAGLWPLALATGTQDEIWPPFATVVMGGLVASTVLTLLVIPVGFVLLRRLDEIFGRLGPWVVLGWLAATAASVTPFIWSDQITSLTWQLITTILVAGAWLLVILLVWRRSPLPVPAVGPAGAPEFDLRYLSKTYGKPGAIGEAWRSWELFADRVLARGGRPFHPADAWGRLIPLALLSGAALYLAGFVQSGFWRLVFVFVAASFVTGFLVQLRRGRGRTDERGRVDPGGPEAVAAFFMPWIGWVYIAMSSTILPQLAGERSGSLVFPAIGLASLALLIASIQFGRRSARAIARGELSEVVSEGRLRYPRTFLRHLSRRVFGLDLPREEVRALREVHLKAQRGMVGILGPNGAGKTTLLRLLAGILDPTGGKIFLGEIPLQKLRKHLARWLGYLPQDFGLPKAMSAREYLDYFALLYEIGTKDERRERVDRLLDEVGLGERGDEKIGGYSGGMRQRVAIARTLLRLPPVIIVDEPTVGLDPRERIRFRNLLSRLAEGRIVLFSTHVVEDVAVACERVIVMAEGRVVYDGLPGELADQAAGHSWQYHAEAGELPELGGDTLITDQVPEADGSLRVRILSAVKPHEDAVSTAPTLEDGYLVLVANHNGGLAR